MAQNRNWPALIRAYAQQAGVDPQAALAVSRMEGLSGRVGDGGHAFGPFQMNDAGGVLTNRPGNHRAYAESPAGIREAIFAMAKNGARGLTGAAAVRAIVNNYERPAAPGPEIAGALAHYGAALPDGYAPMANASLGSNSAIGSDPLSARRNALLQGIFSRDAAYTGYTGTADAFKAYAAQAASQPQDASGGPSAMQAAPMAGNGATANLGGLQWLGDTSGVHPNLLTGVSSAARARGATKIRVNSGYRSVAHNAAVGGAGHSNHTTGDALDGEAYVPGHGWVPLGTLLLPVAAKYGLRSGDVPGFFNGNRDPVHVDDGANQR